MKYEGHHHREKEFGERAARSFDAADTTPRAIQRHFDQAWGTAPVGLERSIAHLVYWVTVRFRIDPEAYHVQKDDDGLWVLPPLSSGRSPDFIPDEP